MTKKAREQMKQRIHEHGKKLLKLFPRASIQDPARLAARAYRIEVRVHQAQEDACNGPPEGMRSHEEQEAWAARIAKIERRAEIDFQILFGVPLSDPFFINGDPRGYSLKVRSGVMHALNIDLPRDWGGYGIIAPDLSEE